MSVKIPFISDGQISKSDATFIDLLRNRICPHFQFVSLSTILIGACLLIFIVTRIAFSPGGYRQFLQSPTQMNKWLLDIELFRHNKAYFYQLITAMFLHQSYRHIIMNAIFAIFIMYELQHCWRWTIPIALVGGFCANCMAVATINGRVLGFSGVLCACVGIQFAALILHCNYLRQVYPNQFYMVFLMILITLLMIVGFTGSGLIHFFGLTYGLLFGLALYPKMVEASVNDNLVKVFKILSLGFLGLAVLLAMIS